MNLWVFNSLHLYMHLHVDCCFSHFSFGKHIIISSIVFGLVFSVQEILLDIRAPHSESHVVYVFFTSLPIRHEFGTTGPYCKIQVSLSQHTI